jgi:hypothetical protein
MQAVKERPKDPRARFYLANTLRCVLVVPTSLIVPQCGPGVAWFFTSIQTLLFVSAL